MKFNKMLTNRSFMHMPSWQIVYEWEEDISSALGLQLKSALIPKTIFDNPITRFFLGNKHSSNFVKNTDLLLSSVMKSIAFDLFPRPKFSYLTSTNVAPIIIDFWKNTDINTFYQNYQNCPFVCISSLEALRYLESQNISLKLHHLPLSISDRYKTDFGSIHAKKRYDIITVGRENPVLEAYLSDFVKKHPELNIVYRKMEKGHINFYSTIDGFLGTFDTRHKYFDLLKACRIGLYSTPGIDGGEVRTGGFNPVTPRFLELLSAGCRVIARYADNDDTRFYEMNDIVANINTYKDFEDNIYNYLNTKEFPVLQYEQYLSKHFTSNRIEKLEKIFKIYE